ncbi:MAG: DNA-processing protein DprA [Treponema sp.]
MDELSLAISSLTFLSFNEKIILHKNLDSLDKLALMSIEDISKEVGRAVKPEFWNGRTAAALAKKSASLMQKMAIEAVLYDDEKFPALLSTIHDPPFALFYRGNIDVLFKKCVSVVGTRRICPECSKAAFSFAKDAALDGVTVVSGLAYGVDCFAHKGAVNAIEERKALGSTAAVLPCGIDTITPASHKTLALHILKCGGCILSEYLPGTPSEPYRFVQRNRIIAGLSPATVVIQAPPGSGALLTADFALDYNRELVFHESGFCENAKNEARKIEKELAYSTKKNASVKLERTSEKYLEEGAPVINNYADYAIVRQDAPGAHICKNKKQLELF